jgi:hypothetical protein
MWYNSIEKGELYMIEYFIVVNTFAAPIVSDTYTAFEIADTPEGAFYKSQGNKINRIYSANVYLSANDYHKGMKPVFEYRSEKAKKVLGIK